MRETRCAKRSRKRAWSMLAAGYLLFHAPLAAGVEEYQVKAAFLYNLLSFVSWPEQAFASGDAPFRVCVLGADPFGKSLELLAQERGAAGRAVEINRLREIGQAATCHILFVSTSENRFLPKLLPQLEGRPVLTVSDIPGFAEQRGMVEFFVQNSRVRLAINLPAATRMGLKPSADLLKISKLVDSAE